MPVRWLLDLKIRIKEFSKILQKVSIGSQTTYQEQSLGVSKSINDQRFTLGGAPVLRATFVICASTSRRIATNTGSKIRLQSSLSFSGQTSARDLPCEFQEPRLQPNFRNVWCPLHWDQICLSVIVVIIRIEGCFDLVLEVIDGIFHYYLTPYNTGTVSSQLFQENALKAFFQLKCATRIPCPHGTFSDLERSPIGYLVSD